MQFIMLGIFFCAINPSMRLNLHISDMVFRQYGPSNNSMSNIVYLYFQYPKKNHALAKSSLAICFS